MGKSAILIVVVAVVVLAAACICTSVGSYIPAYNNLVAKQNSVEQAFSNVDANERALGEAIKTTLDVFYNTLDQETLTQIGVAEARSRYETAQKSGADPIGPTGALIASLRLVVENPPTTNFATLATGAMAEVNERYNTWRQSIMDVNTVVSGKYGYNTYCAQLFWPKIACSLGGFPQRFDTYKDPDASMQNLSPRPVKPAPTLRP